MSQSSTADPTNMSKRQVLESLSGLLLGMFVSMLAGTVVSTSLPVIVSDLKGDQTVFTWVVTSTLVTTAISTPIWGKLADLLNRKLLIQIALVIFVVSSATAGFAHNPEMLIASRAFQGLGAGGLAALSQVIMADIISPRERGRYMGLFGAIMAVATVGGPLLGGFITDAINWRWNFFVSIPFAIVALILLQTTLHLPKRAKQKVRIDYLGIVLLSAACGLLLIWISMGGKTEATGGFPWASPQTAWMTSLAAAAAIAFVIVELTVKEPLIPLTLFKNRTFTLSVLASIATGVAMFGTSVYLSQYMQMSRGATPTEAGLMTLPMIGGVLLSSMIVGQLITRFGKWKSFMVVGSLMLIAGAAMLTTIHYDTNFVLLSVYMFLMGAGVGMTMQNLVLVVQNTADPSEIGVASSGVTFFRSLGGTVGVSVMGAVLANSLPTLFSDRKAEIGAELAKLGGKGQEIAAGMASNVIPQVATLPDGIRQIFEDIYAIAISNSFVIAVPLAVVSLIAIAFLPNVPLKSQTTAQRLASEEIAMSTEAAGAGMAATTGGIEVITDKTPRPQK